MLAHGPRSDCVIHLYDLLAHPADFDGAVNNLHTVLTAIWNADLHLHPQKCAAFLGHLVSSEGMVTKSGKITAVIQVNSGPPSMPEVLREVYDAASRRQYFNIRDPFRVYCPITKKGW